LLEEIVQNGLLTLVERIGHPAAAGVMLDPAEDGRWPAQAQAQVIAVDFAHLFAVPGEHAVRPYESAYCDTIEIDASTACSAYFHSAPSGPVTGLLHGPSATAVLAVYRQAGFELDPAASELPDHVAIELEFVGRLLESAAERQAAEFFATHLGRWVFRCLHDIKRHAQIAFYCTVADVAETFLRFEERAFAMMDERHVQG
jgi:TorA maturation chaperone TorD